MGSVNRIYHGVFHYSPMITRLKYGSKTKAQFGPFFVQREKSLLTIGLIKENFDTVNL